MNRILIFFFALISLKAVTVYGNWNNSLDWHNFDNLNWRLASGNCPLLNCRMNNDYYWTQICQNGGCDWLNNW